MLDSGSWPIESVRSLWGEFTGDEVADFVSVSDGVLHEVDVDYGSWEGSEGGLGKDLGSLGLVEAFVGVGEVFEEEA